MTRMRLQREFRFDAAHRILGHADRDDPLASAVAAIQAIAPERLALFSRNPTVEVLAQEAFEAITKRLPEGVRLKSVTVWETPTASEYRGDDPD